MSAQFGHVMRFCLHWKDGNICESFILIFQKSMIMFRIASLRAGALVLRGQVAQALGQVILA